MKTANVFATFDVLAVTELPSLLLFRADGQGAGEPIDLGHLRTEAQLTEAVMRHSSTTLRRPADLGRLEELVEMLPRFSAETTLLLEENQRLRFQLADARRQLGLARGQGHTAAAGPLQ